MRLDDKVFEEVAEELGELHPDVADGAHRRETPRFLVSGEVMIRPYGVAHAASRSVQLVDISQCGVSVLDRLAISPGHQFVLYLPRAGGNTFEALCVVRQCRLGMEGLFRIGAEFTEEIPHRRLLGSVGGLVETGQVAVGHDAEHAEHVTTAQVTSQDNAGEEVSVTLLNASADGFTLASTHAYAVGERLIIEYAAANSRTVRWNCTVIHVRHANNGLFRINASSDGPIELPPQGLKAKLAGWLRRDKAD